MSLKNSSRCFLLLIISIVSLVLLSGCGNTKKTEPSDTPSKLSVENIKIDKNLVEPLIPNTLYETEKIMIVSGIHSSIIMYNKEKKEITKSVIIKDDGKQIPINTQGDDAHGSFIDTGKSKITILNIMKPTKYMYVYDIKDNTVQKKENKFTQGELDKINSKSVKLSKRWVYVGDNQSCPKNLLYKSNYDHKHYRIFK